MRLGGPVSGYGEDPERWVATHKEHGYTAAYSPVRQADGPDPAARARPFLEAARAADLLVAEVGSWSNPIDPDAAKARQALEKCQRKLALAEEMGVACCVNIVGSRNTQKWDGPHPDNFTDDTFALIVETTRQIIDAVRPTRAFYCLETMPWIFPSSPDEYLALLRAIDRPAAAVHLDPVNMINSPARAYRTSDFIRECFAKLGPMIKSCHAKDIILQDKLTVHLDECRPGTGVLDYGAFLTKLSKLDANTPLMLEHLPAEEYPAAAEYIRSVARERGLSWR